jgi:hypothetical protein
MANRKKAKAPKVKRQPRCLHGYRIPKTGTLHETVLLGLQKIAKSEGKSVSWVIHEIIADFFGRDIMGDKV